MEELMKEHGGFEHNKQSFRIVTLLENPYPDFRGLNLTYEVLEGICKHATEYDLPDKSLFVKDGYPSIEAQIANYADEIAYNNHDIDDGLKSGLIKREDLKEVALWQENYERIKKDHDNMSPTQKRRFTVKSTINQLVTDLIMNTSEKIEALNIDHIDTVREKGKNLVSFSGKTKALNTELKRFLNERLYRHDKVLRMQDDSKKVIQDLFQAYSNNTNLIPPVFKSFYGKAEPIERVICDYIAGMTDRFALGERDKIV